MALGKGAVAGGRGVRDFLFVGGRLGWGGCLFGGLWWQRWVVRRFGADRVLASPGVVGSGRWVCHPSSVVEHSLGKGEVVGSNPMGGFVPGGVAGRRILPPI